MDKLKALLAENNLTASYLKKGDRIDIAGQFKIKAVWPSENTKISILNQASNINEISNDSSLVLLLSCDRFKFLITGDTSSLLLSQKQDLSNINIIKVPHHGGEGSLGEKSLTRLNPKLVVISVGKNKYGHSSKEAVVLLKKFNIMILRTDLNGEIEIVSNEKSGKPN
ncbi:hypothetical protein KKG52_01150 [Patescibacteria group bacterium]|nr:hypothetical protein [Patescibacteria group bacterium]